MPKETHQMTEVLPFIETKGRWFRNHIMDLTIKFDNQEINSEYDVKFFELNFSNMGKSYMLRWENGNVMTFKVDKGEQDIRKNNSPLLKAFDDISLLDIKNSFEKYSQEIPKSIRDFVLKNI